MFVCYSVLRYESSNYRAYFHCHTLIWKLYIHCGANRLHPFYFWNNFVKPHYISVILAHRYWSKFATKLPTSPDSCSHLTLWNETSQFVYNSSNVCIESHDSYRETHHSKCSVFAFDFETRIKTILPLDQCSFAGCWPYFSQMLL